MKILYLLLVIAGGYYAYDYLTAKEPPAPRLPGPLERPAAPPPVDFADTASVRKLLAEWKSRTLGDPSGGHGVEGSPALNADVELREIRRRLFNRGIHDESAVADVIQRALRELGVKESEVQGLASSIMGMR
ncbi:MAG: hypothetical protein ACKOKC_16645 [Chthoniobacterales bacterium]